MLSVARHWGNEPHQARRIASEMQIPYKVLTQILANLVADGLLVATQGPKGGYRLGRPPADITLLDVIESSEGPVIFNHCVLRDGPCDWEETCPIHDTWSRAQDALARELASATLAALTSIDAAIEAGGYQSDTPPHHNRTERHGKRT
jgi:Rrf2 family protein